MNRRLLGLTTILTLLALPLSQSAWSSVTVDELMRRHLEALGGAEAVQSIRSVISTSEIEMVGIGIKGTMKSYDLMPCLSYSEISFGLFNIKQGYDGERRWMVDPNGKLQFVRDPGSLEDQVTNCLIESRNYLFTPEDVTVNAADQDTIDGVPCEVIELLPTGGTPCRIYLDASTFLIKRLVMEARDGRVEQTFDDYRVIKGVMFPFRARIHQVSMNQTIEFCVQSISVNEEIDPVVFLPPSSDVKDYQFTNGHAARDVPFVYRQRHIYLPVRIGDRPEEVMFLLDSGASMTVIDSTLAVERDYSLGGKISGAGAGGMADFYMTRIPGFSIEGIAFSNQTVIAYPISTLMRRFVDIEVGGVLGYDFLSRFVTRIDYENKLISFFEPDSFAPPPGATTFDAPLTHNIFSFQGLLDGAYSGTFLLDTGANSSMLQKNFVEENELADTTRMLNVYISGAGGEESAAIYRFLSFQLGEFSIARPVFAISSSKRGIGAFEGISGIIGNDILERFTITLNYESQQIQLEKNSHFANRFFNDRAGLRLQRTRDGKITIHFIIPGSSSEKAGFMAGDEILSIDGREVSHFKNLEEVLHLFESKEGTVRNVEILRSGKKMVRSIVLEDYI